ncbi:MAG TPA: hypothetical protein VLH56_16460 [Dissulfurispiraceae bacterium]|nr:hypothetical protein [Dissulfurispiraceae bacterium]
MDPMMIIAIAELAKMAFAGIFAYMRQAGLTDAQIEDAFQSAKRAMYERDPAKIPGS